MNIRLEYSQAQGKFKQSQAKEQTDVLSGYKTLCYFVEQDRAIRFVNAIHLKYPELASADNATYPTLQLMRHELLEFMDEDLKVLEAHMNQTYKRRSQLFNQF